MWSNKNYIIAFFLFMYFLIHLIVALVIDENHAFAPDELNYIESFNSIFHNGGTFGSISGWPATSKFVVQVLNFPAFLLTQVGIGDWLALRINAIMFASLFTFLLLMELERSNSKKIVKLLFIFVLFTPSFFVFTTLGIKESYLYFALVFVFTCINKFFRVKSPSLFLHLLVILSGYLLLNIKPYLFFLLLITTVFVSILSAFVRKKDMARNFVILGLMSISLALSPPAVSVFAQNIDAFMNQLSSPLNVNSIETVNSSETIKLLNKADTTSALHFLLEFFDLTVDNLDVLEHNASNYDNGELIRGTFKSPAQSIESFYYFLFSPVIATKYESKVINILKLESPFWLLTYLLLIFVCTKILKTRKIPDSSVIFPAIYLIGFVILSAFTETNLGTAIRHKGVLIILTLLLVATSESKEKDRIKGITI